jgi:hypothetical protein
MEQIEVYAPGTKNSPVWDRASLEYFATNSNRSDLYKGQIEIKASEPRHEFSVKVKTNVGDFWMTVPENNFVVDPPVVAAPVVIAPAAAPKIFRTSVLTKNGEDWPRQPPAERRVFNYTVAPSADGKTAIISGNTASRGAISETVDIRDDGTFWFKDSRGSDKVEIYGKVNADGAEIISYFDRKGRIGSTAPEFFYINTNR